MNYRVLLPVAALAIYFSLMTSCDLEHSKDKSPNDTTKTDTTKTDTTKTDTTTCPYPDTSNCTGFFSFGNYIPKGKIVFYGNFQPRGTGIYIIGIDTHGLKPLLVQGDSFLVLGQNQAQFGGFIDGHPSFSNSGKKVISQFALGFDDGGSMVYDTLGRNKIYSYVGAAYPRWRPDDSTIAYFTGSSASYPAVAGATIFLTTYPFAQAVFCKDTIIFGPFLGYYPIPPGSFLLSPRPFFWTPDGKYVIGFGRVKDQYDLFEVDYVTHTIVSRMTYNSILEDHIEVSKDNKYAAFRQNGLIYVYPLCELSKAHPQGMAIPSGTITGNQVIRFSKDSRFVVFDGKLAGDAESFIYLADLANGGQVKKIIAGQHPDIFVE